MLASYGEIRVIVAQCLLYKGAFYFLGKGVWEMLKLEREPSDRFNPAVAQVKDNFNSVNASGAAAFIIYKDRIVAEKYWGMQSRDANARKVQEDTQFHVASVRKSYIGYAAAYAVHSGAISSIDDQVTDYLIDLEPALVNGVTIRHLLTHSHGLVLEDGKVRREFSPGTNWAYRGIGVELLTKLIYQTTGQTVAEILSNQVFRPLGFRESGWYTELGPKHAEVIREPNQKHWTISDSVAGDAMNMYVSTRELAYWGYLHLQHGVINGNQVVPKEILTMATSLQSPAYRDLELPQNGFLWFVKDLPARRTEIGENVPAGAYQILGYTGVALLVIPQHQVVAVRAFNSFGSPDGFDYLADIRAWGNTIMTCLRN